MAIEELTAEEVREVYRTRLVRDFPPNEVKRLSLIEKTARRGGYRCYGLKDGDGLLAYAFFMVLERQALLDYYAVRQDLRGTGVGSRFLRELGEGVMKGNDCVLLETEDPDAVTDPEAKMKRERRLHFYLKNGLLDTGVRSRVYGADYRILQFPGGAIPERNEVTARYTAHYRDILPFWRRLLHVKIKI